VATTTPAAEALPFPKFNFVTKAFGTEGSESTPEAPPRFSAIARYIAIRIAAAPLIVTLG